MEKGERIFFPPKMKTFKVNSETISLEMYGITNLLCHLPNEVSLEEKSLFCFLI